MSGEPIDEKAGLKESEGAEEQAMSQQPFKFYLKPSVVFKVCVTKWGLFTILSGIPYVYHLIMAVYGTD